jgi:iron complex outermembrane receptor protein
MLLRKTNSLSGAQPCARRGSQRLRYAIAAALGGASLYAGSAAAQLEEIIVTATFRETNVQQTPIAITAVNAAMLESRGQTNIVEVARQAPNVRMTPAGQGAGSAMITYIRGIGQTDFNYALEPGIGMYVDDVYYPNLTGSMVELLDIERVEIARGPQGTLAGRNSIGGSVKIYSVEPTHGSDSGIAELVVGDYDQIALKGAADLTFIEDKLSARISGISSSRNGYVHRLDYKCTHPGWGGPTFQNGRLDNCKLGDLGGESFTGGRFALLWTPSDSFRVKVLGDLINQDNESAALVLTRVTNPRHLPQAPSPTGVLTGTGQFNPATDLQEGTFLDVDGNMTTSADRVYLNSQFVTHGQYRGDPLVDDPYTTYATFLDPMPPQTNRPYSPQTVDPGVEFDDQGLSVQIDWDISDNLSLMWISAMREYEDVFAYDTDGTPFFSQGGTQGLSHEHTTHEVRFSGVALNERLDWTVGAFSVDQNRAQHIGQIDLYYAQLNFIHGPDLTPSDSQAIFAHTAWHLTEKFDMELGYRKTEDSKFYQWQRHNPDGTNVVPCTPGLRGGANSLLNPPNCAIFGFSGLSQTFESDRDDYRVALNYGITDNLMLYGSFATGYKGGGINPRPFFAVQIATFGEEEVETTELGLKATLANGRVRLNGAIFTNDQKGIQLNQAACEVLIPQAGQTPFPVTIGGVTYPNVFIGPPCAKPQNIGDAETDGVELEMNILATDRLSFDLMASSVDFVYTRLDPTVAHSSVVPGGRGQMTFDMKTPFSPEFTWSAGIQYEWPLSGGGSFTARVDAAYQDEVYTQAVNYLQVQPVNDRKTAWIDEYTLSHARFSWRSANGGWETALDVSNLSDEVYYQSIVDGVYTTVGYQSSVIAPPRMWTMHFRKSFGL